MTHVHFAYGWINPLLGFGFALAGAYLGLTCMVRARRHPVGRTRRRWLALAALSIGGIGIWVMHFIAMIGFTVDVGDVRYDVGITAASLLISILSVAFGLFVVGTGNPSILKLAIGGPLTGLGVVAMHYTGMAAVNIHGVIEYDLLWVVGSVAVAIVAATTALYFTTWVDGRPWLITASGVMALAVCGMHYTGMGAIATVPDSGRLAPVEGVEPLLLLLPILALATASLIALIVGVLTDGDDFAEEPPPAAFGAQAYPDFRLRRDNRDHAPVLARPAQNAHTEPGTNPHPSPSVERRSAGDLAAGMQSARRAHSGTRTTTAASATRLPPQDLPRMEPEHAVTALPSRSPGSSYRSRDHAEPGAPR